MKEESGSPHVRAGDNAVHESPGRVPTVEEAVEAYLGEVARSRSPLTHRAYAQAMSRFVEVLCQHGVSPGAEPVSSASTQWVAWYIDALRRYAVATEQLFLTALSGFYEYIAAEGWSAVNLAAVRELRRRRSRREATRLPPFPRREIERILETVRREVSLVQGDERAMLRALRDRALLFTLADTGLRVSEACSLTRGHLDWNEARAVVLGKGGLEAVVRFSERSLHYLRVYIDARATLDGSQGRALSSLPLFARHDRGAGKRVLALSPRSVERIVEQWAVRALGDQARGMITPHTFRHYFVTVVLRGSGGNIRLAQELARHRGIATTQRYAHLSDDDLDRGYHRIFNEAADPE